MVLSLEKIWWLVDQFELPTRHWLSVSYLPFFCVPFSQEKNQRRLLPNMRKSQVLIIRPEQCQRSSAWSSQFSAAVASKLFQFGVCFTQIELYESHRPGPTSSDSDLDTSDDEEFAGVSALAIAFNIAKGRNFREDFDGDIEWQWSLYFGNLCLDCTKLATNIAPQMAILKTFLFQRWDTFVPRCELTARSKSSICHWVLCIPMNHPRHSSEKGMMKRVFHPGSHDLLKWQELHTSR